MEDEPFYCDTCKKIVDKAKFDGYSFGDRLLEGVMFLATKTGDKVKITILKDCEYWQGLNTKKWLKAAKDYFEDLDIAACFYCNDDILVNKEN